MPGSKQQKGCDMSPAKSSCPDCSTSIGRRDFLQRTAATALGCGLYAVAGPLPGAWAAPTSQSPAETAAQQLYQVLTPAQKSQICFPFNHPSRTRINANWAVSKPAIHEDFYTPEQRQLIAQVFRGVTSEEGHARFLEQMEFDSGGFDRYHVALFGEPGQDGFEWELTGRHLTIRADGDSVAGAAFGGPIVYGHGEEDPADNIFYYQTKQANEVFRALSAEQASQALLKNAPKEAEVQLRGAQGKFSGISVGSLSEDQRALVKSVVQSLLAPYREEDVQEAMKIIDQGGGFEALNMAFYRQDDLRNDGEWDLWRIEGPTFVSHFRGAPHVHAYLNVGVSKQA
jgi:hypothetical protein